MTREELEQVDDLMCRIIGFEDWMWHRDAALYGVRVLENSLSSFWDAVWVTPARCIFRIINWIIGRR